MLHPFYTEQLQQLRLERAEVANKLNKIVDTKASAETFNEGFGSDWGLYKDFTDKKYRALSEYFILLEAEISLLESLLGVEY